VTRFWPQRLTGQLIASILLALVAAQAITLLIFHDERRAAVRAASRAEILSRTAAMVRLLNETPPRYHQQIIDSASGPRLRFSLDSESLLPAGARGGAGVALESRLVELLGPDAREVRVAVETRSARALPDVRERRRRDRDDDDDHADEAHRDARADWREGRKKEWKGKDRRRRFPDLTISVLPQSPLWLNIRTLVPPGPPPWALPSVVTLAATALALVAIVVLVVRRATRPLGELAGAAERLGRGETVPPLEERGPEDVRTTIRAFNVMRDRLSRYLQERTQMLAAISHDLRTPITSLRLRAELVEDGENRTRILQSLDEMQNMTEATLDFIREEATDEKTRSVDLAALIESVCADLSDLGHPISVSAAPPSPYPCRVHAITRAVRNLVENAVTYGQRARVTLRRDPDGFAIVIDDDGPGIPEGDMVRVLEPFVRLEASRSRETGGIGMGLAIAASIARAHGGRVTLANRAGGGLSAVLHLPVAESFG